MTPTPRMLRLPTVIELTGLGRDSIYRLARAGEFPKPRKIAARASAWREDEVRAWIEALPEAQLSDTAIAFREGAEEARRAEVSAASVVRDESLKILAGRVRLARKSRQ
jgi:prophage regulatory protein